MTQLSDPHLATREDRHLALTHRLEQSVDRGGLRALVLADEDGLVVAAAGEPSLSEELGALAPLLARCQPAQLACEMCVPADTLVHPVRLLDQPLYLTCAGGGVARSALLRQAVEDIERILVSN